MLSRSELVGEIGVIWSDVRRGNRTVFMQVIKTDGELKFQENGIVVSSEPGRHQNPLLIPVSDGGWICAWVGFQADTLGDIYCAKIDANGDHV